MVEHRRRAGSPRSPKLGNSTRSGSHTIAVVAVGNAIAHQVYVWFCWRTELRNRLVTRTVGFRAYAVVFAVLILLRPFLVCPQHAAMATADGARAVVVAVAPATADEDVTPPANPAPPEAPRPDSPATPGREAADEGAAGEIPDSSRDTRGATGEGRSAEASAAQGAGQSKGVPSTQGQVSVPTEQKRKKKRRKRPDEPEADA